MNDVSGQSCSQSFDLSASGPNPDTTVPDALCGLGLQPTPGVWPKKPCTLSVNPSTGYDGFSSNWTMTVDMPPDGPQPAVVACYTGNWTSNLGYIQGCLDPSPTPGQFGAVATVRRYTSTNFQLTCDVLDASVDQSICSGPTPPHVACTQPGVPSNCTVLCSDTKTITDLGCNPGPC